MVTSDKSGKASQTKKPFVPPGFEDLLEPQTTQVDVHYGGLFITSTLATFTPTDIEFLQPAEIVDRIPDILAPSQVLSILKQSMPTNTAFLCLKANQTGCGKIDTSSVDVIFDESNFRVDLFLAPDLLTVRPAVSSKFLPPSSAGLSVLNQIGITTNGTEGETNNYNIANSTTISFKETRLVGISNITRSEDFTFDTLALEREFSGQQYQAGYFRSSPANLLFVNQSDFLGFTLGSSLDTRKDLDQSSGNDLQVFLDSRSRVDILKDGRLISTAIYETGNQILDTSALPGGAYDIVLRIRDNFGGDREETRFYVKTNRLPPIDQTVYFINIGERTTREDGNSLPTGMGTTLIRAGLSKRFSSSFGGDFGFLLEENKALVEAGLFKLGRIYDWRLNTAFAESDFAANLNTRLRLGKLTFGANLRKTWIKEDQTSTSIQPGSLLGNAVTQGSLNLSFPLRAGSFSLTSRYNKRSGSTDKNLGVRYDFKSTRFGNRVLDTNIQFTEDNGDQLFLISLRLRFAKGRWQTNWGSELYADTTTLTTNNPFAEVTQRDNGFNTNIQTNWQDGEKYLSDIRYSMRASHERSEQSLESELDIASEFGRSSLDVAWSDTREQLSYGASFYSNLIMSPGNFSFGGKRFARSAIVMDIEGAVDDAFFDIAVNGSPGGNARIGTKTILPLRPYETYEITLQPRGETLLQFNNQVQQATLYPGNVVTMHWKAAKILCAFGQIVDPAGAPIKNALIEGVVGLATTDEFGFFQAEIDTGATQLVVKTRTSSCTASLNPADETEVVVLLGEISCK